MPSHSKSQQHFMGMVYAYKMGKIKNPSVDIIKAAESISLKDAKDFASTKHDNLPESTTTQQRFKDFLVVNEGMFDYAKGALGHVGTTMVDKLNSYGDSSRAARFMGDVRNAGKKAAEQGNLKTSIQKNVKQLAVILKQFDAIKTQIAPTAGQAQQNTAVVTPPVASTNKTAPAQKAKMTAGKYGDEYVFNSMVAQALGVQLNEGPLDFAVGAVKSVGGGLAAGAKHMYAAGKAASNQGLMKQIKQLQQHAFQLAAVVIANTQKLGPVGEDLLAKALRTVPLQTAERIRKLLAKRQQSVGA